MSKPVSESPNVVVRQSLPVRLTSRGVWSVPAPDRSMRAPFLQHVTKPSSMQSQAEDEWVRTIVDLSQMNMKFLETCTPGYYNNEGNPAARDARDGPYGAGSPAFIRLLEDWRARGDLAGLEVA